MVGTVALARVSLLAAPPLVGALALLNLPRSEEPETGRAGSSVCCLR